LIGPREVSVTGYLRLAAEIYGVQAWGKGLYLQSQNIVEHKQLLNVMQSCKKKQHSDTCINKT